MDKISESAGLFIPPTIMQDKRLSWTEKALLSQIYWYNKNEGCYASNQYLANLLNVSVRQIQRMLNKLIKLRLIKKSHNKNRIIIVNRDINVTPMTNMSPPCQKCHVDHDKFVTPVIIKKNIKKNINTTSSIKKNSIEFDREKRQFENITKQDIEYWKNAYPGVNIDNEILQAAEWCYSNSVKIKNRKDLRKTLINWFSREQDKKKPDKPKQQKDKKYNLNEVTAIDNCSRELLKLDWPINKINTAINEALNKGIKPIDLMKYLKKGSLELYEL